MRQDDELAFAKLLLTNRGNRTKKEICKLSGFNYQRISRFEGCQYFTISLPNDAELAVLVRVYGLDQKDAENALAEARRAKKSLKSVLINLGKKERKPKEAVFSGSIASRQELRTHNSNVYGRKVW